MFVSTDARRPYPCGVIGSTVGTYPRGTGSNPVEGNGHFFPSLRQLYLSSFSDTHTHTHTHTLSLSLLPCVLLNRGASPEVDETIVIMILQLGVASNLWSKQKCCIRLV